MRIAVLNGPNLNVLGQRDPKLYGAQTLDEVEALCRSRCQDKGFELDFFQSNFEGALVEKIQQCRDAAALIINPGAYTHTSIAIHDALELLTCPIIEVHISNIHAREAFRATSYVSKQATGLIVGLGVNGYALAIEAAAELIATS